MVEKKVAERKSSARQEVEMNTQTIQAEARSESGKGIARKLRAASRIPAVAYGGQTAPRQLSLDPKQLQDLRKSPLGWNQPVTIEVDGGENVSLALLREVQRHPVSGQFLHADFMCIEANAQVVVQVPLHLIGKSPGEALGGRISQPKRAVAVLCTPDTIPNAVEIDISTLEVGDRILLSEVTFPSGVSSHYAHDAPAVSCVGRRGGAAEEEGEGASDEAAEAEGGEE
jgi:large subunit ribosomal protein L25